MCCTCSPAVFVGYRRRGIIPLSTASARVVSLVTEDLTTVSLCFEADYFLQLASLY